MASTALQRLPRTTAWIARLGRIALIALGSAAGSCAQPPAPSAPPSPAAPPAPAAPRAAATPASALADIDRLIGSAACTRDDECRVVGVGALACGGPEVYRTWSIRDTDAAALEAAVRRDAAARREALEREGRMSVCRVVPVPAVACVRSAGQPVGRCTLEPVRGDSLPR